MLFTFAYMLPSQFTDKSGKISHLGIAFFALTVVALAYNIYESHKHIVDITKTDALQQKEIDELKSNLKTLMGDKYQTL